MMTLRTLAIVIAGAGVFAGLPLTDAQACDDDRFPCPVVSETSTQETAAPARPAPSAQPRKKVNHPARPDEKAHAKVEREAPRAAARTTAGKPAVQRQAADSIPQKAAEAAPAMVPSPPSDQSLNDESRNESLVATVATAWSVLPNTDGAGASAPGATGVDVTEVAKANVVQVVDSNEVNELDRAATAPAESSWAAYLLLILGAALAAASAMWFLPRLTSIYARRAAGPRMHMSNSRNEAVISQRPAHFRIATGAPTARSISASCS